MTARRRSRVSVRRDTVRYSANANRIELSGAHPADRQNNRETDYECISNQSHKSAILFCDSETRNNLSCLNPDGGGAVSNRQENRMDSISLFRANWKMRLEQLPKIISG